MELSVIIPTHNRRAILGETLTRLEAQAGDAEFEVVVVDDGSVDGTADWLRERAQGSQMPITVWRQQASGRAAARNAGLAAAKAPVCLNLDDDTWPCRGLIRRHVDFHARRPEIEAALLGRVVIAESPPPTPFMRWLADLHLGFDDIDDPEDAGGAHFYSGNASAKTRFLHEAGGFDEGFTSTSDIDLGLRLEQRGMRLAHDAEALVEHYQPTDLYRTIARMFDIGRTLARLKERHPDRPVARRPGARHRLKAASLTALALAGVRTPRVQRETWRFLCHEAAREGYWDAVDGRSERDAAPVLRVGRTLARLASRDPDAQMPSYGLDAITDRSQGRGLVA